MVFELQGFFGYYRDLIFYLWRWGNWRPWEMGYIQGHRSYWWQNPDLPILSVWCCHLGATSTWWLWTLQEQPSAAFYFQSYARTGRALLLLLLNQTVLSWSLPRVWWHSDWGGHSLWFQTSTGLNLCSDPFQLCAPGQLNFSDTQVLCT